MATKKTYTAEITCDVCKKKETIHEGDPQSLTLLVALLEK